jgi:hypothetical protein
MNPITHPRCGGTKVLRRDVGKWDVNKQCVILDQEFDFYFCEDCKRIFPIERQPSAENASRTDVGNAVGNSGKQGPV